MRVYPKDKRVPRPQPNEQKQKNYGYEIKKIDDKTKELEEKVK